MLDWKEKSFAYIVSDSGRYRARYYAAWIVRFVSVDSLQYKYQYYMSCQYAGNKPITYIDLDGLEEDNPANRYSLQCNNFSDKNAPQQDTFFLALDISNVLSLCLLGSEELLMSENKSQNQVNRTADDAISTCTKSVGR